MKQHQKELGVIAPHIVELDIDSDEYYNQNWDKVGHMSTARKKGRLKKMLRKNKGQKPFQDSADGSNIMVLTSPDLGDKNLEASIDEVRLHHKIAQLYLCLTLNAVLLRSVTQQMEHEMDFGFPRVADKLTALKLAYDQGDLENGREELDAKKIEILGDISNAIASPRAGEETNPLSLDDAATESKSPIASRHPMELPQATGTKRGQHKAATTENETVTNKGAATAAHDEHKISRYFETSSYFAEFETTKLEIKIPHCFQVGDHCMLAELGYSDGCLAANELGEIVFDLYGYSDDVLVLQVRGPRGDTWWYSTDDIVDANDLYANQEEQRLAAEAAVLAEIKAAEAEVLRTLQEEEAALEARRLAEEKEQVRIRHEEEQAQIVAEVSDEDVDAALGTDERRSRTKKEIAGKVAWTGTKVGAKVTYKASKLALQTTKISGNVTYKVASDEKTRQVVKGLAKISAKTTLYTAKGTSTAMKHATPLLADVTKQSLKGGLTAAMILARSAAAVKKSQLSHDEEGENTESLDEALAELERVRLEEKIQEALQDELVKLRWLVDEEVITAEEMRRQTDVIQQAIDADKLRRQTEAQASIGDTKIMDPVEELELWMNSCVRLGKLAEPGSHSKNARRMCEHGVSSLGSLYIMIKSGNLGIIDLLDYGIETQYESTAIWTAMHNSIEKERVFAAMHIQRFYRYKKWAAEVVAARLQNQRQTTTTAAANLGHSHLRKKRWKDALEAFEQALELHPDSAEITDGIEQAKQGMELKEIRKKEGRKNAKKKLAEYEADWKFRGEQRQLEANEQQEALASIERGSMLKRQFEADVLLRSIESGDWDEQKRHAELQAQRNAKEARKRKEREIEHRIKSERAAKVRCCVIILLAS
eukprot:SAG31_NODE_4068_length_3621_cov_1.783078_2_plen_880_part_00